MRRSPTGWTCASSTPPGTAALRAVLPGYVSARNPIDMTTALLGQPQIYGQTLDAVAAQRQADMIFVGFPIGGEGYDFADFSAQTGRFASASGVAVAVSANQEWVAQAFRAQGVPVFDSERAAMQALALLGEYWRTPRGGAGRALARLVCRRRPLPPRRSMKSAAWPNSRRRACPWWRTGSATAPTTCAAPWPNWARRWWRRACPRTSRTSPSTGW